MQFVGMIKQPDDSGFRAALFITPPKLNLYGQQDLPKQDVFCESSLRIPLAEFCPEMINTQQQATVSTEDLHGSQEKPSANPSAPLQCLSMELLKLIDSGESQTSKDRNQEASEAVKDFDLVSNFQSGFQQRLSRLERTRSGKTDQNWRLTGFQGQ